MEERIEDYIKRIESIIKTLSEHIEFEDYDEDVLKEASEDKEAIENLLKRYKELEEENKKYKKLANKNLENEIILREKNAPEDIYLLQNRIEELEKVNSSIKYLNEGLRLDKNILTDMVNDLQEQRRNSIPISVIQNKLEKLKEKEQELSDDEGFWGSSELLYQINILEELLEERNK